MLTLQVTEIPVFSFLYFFPFKTFLKIFSGHQREKCSRWEHKPAKNNDWKSCVPSNKSLTRTFERWNYPWLYECGAGFENRMTFIGLESNQEWKMRGLLGEWTERKSLKLPEKPPFALLSNLCRFSLNNNLRPLNRTQVHTHNTVTCKCITARLKHVQLLVIELQSMLWLLPVSLKLLYLNDKQLTGCSETVDLTLVLAKLHLRPERNSAGTTDQHGSEKSSYMCINLHRNTHKMSVTIMESWLCLVEEETSLVLFVCDRSNWSRLQTCSCRQNKEQRAKKQNARALFDIMMNCIWLSRSADSRSAVAEWRGNLFRVHSCTNACVLWNQNEKLALCSLPHILRCTKVNARMNVSLLWL